MIEQQGQVVAASDGRISVRLGGREGCAACDQGRGCGAGIFGRMLRRRPVRLDFENRIGAVAGQGVIVGIPESAYLRLASRLYLQPLLGGLGGAAIGHHLSGIAGLAGGAQDLSALLAGLAAGGLVLRFARRGDLEISPELEVRLLRTIAGG